MHNIHLKTYIKRTSILFILKQKYIIFSSALGVDTKEYKKSTKGYKKSKKAYKKSTKIVESKKLFTY